MDASVTGRTTPYAPSGAVEEYNTEAGSATAHHRLVHWERNVSEIHWSREYVTLKSALPPLMVALVNGQHFRYARRRVEEECKFGRENATNLLQPDLEKIAMVHGMKARSAMSILVLESMVVSVNGPHSLLARRPVEEDFKCERESATNLRQLKVEKIVLVLDVKPRVARTIYVQECWVAPRHRMLSKTS